MPKEEAPIRQSRVEKLLNKEAGSLRKPTLLVASIVYFLLVIVVIYGAHHHVYDGFGRLAPWIVGGIFLIMAVLRLNEFLRSVSAYKSVKAFLEQRGLLHSAELELEQEEEDAVDSPDYDALDEVSRK